MSMINQNSFQDCMNTKDLNWTIVPLGLVSFVLLLALVPWFLSPILPQKRRGPSTHSWVDSHEAGDEASVAKVQHRMHRVCLFANLADRDVWYMSLNPASTRHHEAGSRAKR